MSKLEVVNELLVVGNGFDLTAKLESGYEDFFKWRSSTLANSSASGASNTVWDYVFNFYKNEGMEYTMPDAPMWRDVEAVLYNFLAYLEPHVTAKTILLETGTQVAQKLSPNENGLLKQYTNDTSFLDALVGHVHRILSMKYSTDFLKYVHDVDSVKLAVAIGKSGYEYGTRMNLRELKGFDNFLNLYRRELTNFENTFVAYMEEMVTAHSEYSRRVNRLLPLITDVYHEDGVAENQNLTIMNFNYTSPFWRLQNEERLEFRSVHGDLKNKKIIFGIDSFINKVDDSQDKRLMPFTKTYRTLLFANHHNGGPKATTEVNAATVEQISFFGHSLGAQDYSYFMALFDEASLYNSNVKVVFYYNIWDSGKEAQIKEDQYTAVAQLMERYGETMTNKYHGQNLLHKLQMENRLAIEEIHPY